MDKEKFAEEKNIPSYFPSLLIHYYLILNKFVTHSDKLVTGLYPAS